MEGGEDLEALEFGIRASMHEVGRSFLERMLIPNSEGREKVEERYKEVGTRKKRILTVLGFVTVPRKYYYDREKGEGLCPRDKELDIEGTTFSPGMRRIMARVGAYRPFELGGEDIEELAGVHVTAKEVERIAERMGKEADKYLMDVKAREEKRESKVDVMYVSMDGTGVPMTRKETEGREGKGEDGQAKTRDAKLGCVFTQTGVDKDGYAVRDELSTSYVGAIERAEEFGRRLSKEANKRGVEGAGRVCVLGDGAPWIWNIAEEYFPGAIQTIDLYHAREHYWSVAKLFFVKSEKQRYGWTERRHKELDNGEVEKVIESIKRLHGKTEEQVEACRREVGYFETNKNRMRYDQYRKKGIFVGSGVIEAGCRSLIGQRLKQSGMHWSVRGANSIITLRCCIFSGLWEDFWAYRAAA